MFTLLPSEWQFLAQAWTQIFRISTKSIIWPVGGAGKTQAPFDLRKGLWTSQKGNSNGP